MFQVVGLLVLLLKDKFQTYLSDLENSFCEISKNKQFVSHMSEIAKTTFQVSILKSET